MVERKAACVPDPPRSRYPRPVSQTPASMPLFYPPYRSRCGNVREGPEVAVSYVVFITLGQHGRLYRPRTEPIRDSVHHPLDVPPARFLLPEGQLTVGPFGGLHPFDPHSDQTQSGPFHSRRVVELPGHGVDLPGHISALLPCPGAVAGAEVRATQFD